MANRAVLNVNGLKVSKPGVNVLTAGINDLLFSDNWSALSKHMSGSLSISSGGNKFVNFGKTFAQVPLVMWEWNGYGDQWIGGAYGTNDTGTITTYGFYADTTRLVFLINGDYYDWPQQVKYTVWDYMI